MSGLLGRADGRRGGVPAGDSHRFECLDDCAASALYVRPRPTDRLPAAGPVDVSPLLQALMVTLSRPVPDAARRARLERVVRDELRDLRPRPFIVAVPADPAARRVALELIADPSDDRPLPELRGASGNVGAHAATTVP